MTTKETYLIAHIERLQATLKVLGECIESPEVKRIIEDNIKNSKSLVETARNHD